MASNRDSGLFSSALSSLKKWGTANRTPRSNSRSLRIETFEKRHLLASVTGTVLEDFTGNGPSADDLPIGGVTVELYRGADDNGIFDESVDVFSGGEDSDPTSGAYAFDGLSDGRYFLRQITPDGFHHVGGLEVYTFDVAGVVVGLVIDDFGTPDPYQVYNISDEYSAPLVVEADDPRILGGQRDLLVEIDGEPTTVSSQVQIGVDQGLRLASASPGTTITLQYDGVDVDPTDQLSVGETFASPIDLTAGGANTGLRIDFDMVEAGLSASEMDIRITATGQTGSAEYVGAVPEANNPSFFVPFTSFTATGSFSFVALSGLQVVLNESAEPNVDFNLDSIVAEDPASAGFDFTNFAGHSVGGVKVEDLTGNGFSEDDQPLGGVTVELYGDTDGDRQFDDTQDTLLATTTTEDGTGAYAFDGLSDGRYFIREVVPTAMSQTDGLEVYTLDISGEFVGLLVDDFAAPEIIEVLQVDDTHPDPTLLESSAAAILGGQRDLLVDVLGNATAVSAQVQVGGADGLRLASSSPGTLIGLQYDGLDTDPADALSVGNTFDSPIDLTGGGMNTGLRIDFGVLEAGIGVTEMDFRVLATSLGGAAEFSGMLPESTDPSHFLPFASFATAGTFSFAELTSLQFMFNENGTEDVDFSINAILAENPTRRGFDFANYGHGSAIDIEKSTNGEDADVGPGPMVAVGDAVTWLYTITNTGFIELFNVHVSDDQVTSLTLISSGNGDDLLGVGETWTYQAIGTAVEGQYANLATVTAMDQREQVVSDEDPSHYFGVVSGIDIEKSTNGQDADIEMGPIIAVGGPVTWMYTVTNMGNVDLFDVVLTDDQGIIPTLIIGDNGDGVLNVGEKWLFEATGTAIEGQYANLATVTALDVLENEVTDEDPSHYFGVASGIDIEKSTNGLDADSQTGPLLAVGDSVIWTYTVTNTGNVDLFDVVVTDDQGIIPTLISGDDGDLVLNVSETWVFTAAGVAEEGQYANLAAVTALDLLEQQVFDEDPSHYFGVASGIDIEKSTNGHDADTPTGPVVTNGFAVAWDYLVTNTGNVVLSEVVVIDDNGTPGDPGDDFSPIFFGGDSDGNGKLDPGETWSFQATGAPVMGQYGNEATVVAYDPFEQSVSDSDPSHYFGVTPAIDIEKATNGQDADTPAGPMIHVGETVTWTYVVTNPGDVALDDVQVTDDNGTPGDTSDDFVLALASGDTNGNDLLDVDETWTYEATGTAEEGQYGNIAEVEAKVVVVGAPALDVADSDPSHYFGILSGIDVEKATNGQDADTETGPIVAAGDQVTWTYVVTNTGNVLLDNVALTDDQGVTPVYQSGDDNDNAVLDIGETWLYEATGTAVAGQYANLATASATDTLDTEVSDQDPSHYFGILSAIDIEKSTNGQDADTETGPMVPVADSVTWTYEVTNTGNAALTNVVVSDDQGVIPVFQSGDDGNGLLDPGETWIYQANGTAEPGQYANLATVTAIDLPGQPVADEDPSHYFGYTAAVDIEKSTNGEDADFGVGFIIGPLVHVGDLVTWLYEVTNTGNLGFDDVAVTDDQGVFPTFQSGDDGNGVLDPGETWVFRATGIATAGKYMNLGAVVAKGPDDIQATDEDSSHYFGVASGIDIEKSTNGQDADSPQGPILVVGNPVTWTYNVTNTGNIDLSNVVVTDDQGAAPALISDGDGDATLDFGETWTYQATGTAEEGQYANLGTVTAIDPLQRQVTDDDPSHYFGEVPNNSSLSGYVYCDVNNDGFFAMGVEQPIPNTKVILVGSDLDGGAINQDTTTDANGYYEFTDLPAGTYRLFELQPSAYLDGKDSIGTPGGDTADDEFSKIDLPTDYEGKENNFGERGLKPEYASKQFLLWPPGTWGTTYDGHNSDPQAGPISPEVYAASTAVAPRTAPIVGTPGDDLLEVYAGDWTVTLNGEVIEIDPLSTSLQFDGFMGEDTVILHGTDGDDAVTLDADGVKLIGSNYTITISDAEKITVDGHGGSNRAVIHDSQGHDLLKAKASWALFIGEGFEHTLWGFSNLQATASEGYDVAMIYDSPGDDRLVAHPTSATFSGDGFELKFDYFNGLHAYGTSGGHDVAELFDSAADDTFVADAKQSALFAPGYYNRAKYFEEVIAHATTGNDQAWLFDSVGNDLLEAADDWARLTIAGRTSEIDRFDTVRADSSQGGQDNKKLDAVDFLMFADGPWLDQ